MNRYPVWKYAIIVIALVVGALYTLPNFFGEAPAVQVSPARPRQGGHGHAGRVEEALKGAGLKADLITFDGNSVKARFDSPRTTSSRPRMRSRRR
jgi:preprotein translocase subunit SecD